MKILLVGKTGVLDTLAVGCGYLERNTIKDSPYFADLSIENSKQLIKIGQDKTNHELFVVGYNAPEIVCIINRELVSLSNLKEKDSLQVIPISVAGENITWLLSKLANIPLIGSWFLQWAQRRTLSRSSYLLRVGHDLRTGKNTGANGKAELIAAAKPLKKGKNQ